MFSTSPVLALAPMAGYTDVAFRELMARRGADLVFSELASATAFARSSTTKTNVAKTKRIIQVGASGVTGIQLFGASPADLECAVKQIGAQIESGECKAQLIDLNYGCPSPKVTKNGAGSALLDDPKRMAEFAQAALKASPVPVTAKIRLGYRVKNNTAIAIALEGAGISALTVHGRTAAQKFSGKADWESIGEVVRAVDVPVFGNGDVRTPSDVARIGEVSGCQGVMVGRGALCDPLFFSNVREYLKNGKSSPTPWRDKVIFLRDYAALSVPYSIPFHAAKEVALQLADGFRGASRLREEISNCHGPAQLLNVMEKHEITG